MWLGWGRWQGDGWGLLCLTRGAVAGQGEGLAASRSPQGRHRRPLRLLRLHDRAVAGRRDPQPERSQLIWNCSHNHSGPVFDDVLPLYYDLTEQQLEVTRYIVFLEAQVQAAITEALAVFAPASVSWGQGSVALRNRRRSRFGSRHLPTIVDQDVLVLSVRDAFLLVAVLFGYSCHATAINDLKVNGDWCGHASVEEAHPGTVALYIAMGGQQPTAAPRPCRRPRPHVRHHPRSGGGGGPRRDRPRAAAAAAYGQTTRFRSAAHSRGA